ncbi:MAG: 50S ribosomal protein L11 methyltransferase [Gammaproteobacteria bacterium]|nr:50S ribosomal protein L11 methyltransferase [Gammaproteobacteria bacterium]MDH5651884.1 50S ribosomal protein L11 methyltransferase [Gammaproteobacteria bacterium]
MPWVQLKLYVAPQQAEVIETALTRLGAAAVTMQDAADQPLFEPPLGTTPLWEHTEITGLFPAETDSDALIAQLIQQPGIDTLPHWKAEILEDQDWTSAWLDRFKPMRFGNRLWICPSAYSPPEPDAVNIFLDPGLAFGTGTHPTTAMCLEWLDGHPPQDLDVIDYGCGSGILALAAGKLGAANIRAVDNDPQALLATRDNSANNALTDRIQAFLPEQVPTAPCDLLLANILAGPLAQLAPTLTALLKPGGHLVLSGLLAGQAEETIRAYRPGIELTIHAQKEEWICLHGQRQA